MKTLFTMQQVELRGTKLWFDGNGKITAGNGTFKAPKPNSFSIKHIEDCPGATELCKSECYVHGIQTHNDPVYAAYHRNSVNIRFAMQADDNERAALAHEMGKWIRANAPHGFRWHVSGDIFSGEYAQFIDLASHLSGVPCWIYTRSFEFIEYLQAVELTVNISADAENWPAAREVYRRTGHRLCYMTINGDVPPDLPEGSVIFPGYTLRGRDYADPKTHWWWQGLTQDQRKMVCPPDFFGQGEKRRCGPCNKCL